jgi:uncharacterized protein YjdB
VTKILLSETAVTMLSDDTVLLNTSILPKNATDKSVAWSSGDEKIATVNQSGKVTARAAGTVKITAKTADGGKTAVCTVTVLPISVTRVALLESNVSIQTGDVQKLNAAISPINATNKNCTWSSSNSAVASVDNQGLVRGLKVGSATITVKTADGGKIASCDVRFCPFV